MTRVRWSPVVVAALALAPLATPAGTREGPTALTHAARARAPRGRGSGATRAWRPAGRRSPQREHRREAAQDEVPRGCAPDVDAHADAGSNSTSSGATRTVTGAPSANPSAARGLALWTRSTTPVGSSTSQAASHPR